MLAEEHVPFSGELLKLYSRLDYVIDANVTFDKCVVKPQLMA